METTIINIEVLVKAPVAKVWEVWTDPTQIIKWSTATPEWHTPRAQHDLKVGGTFLYRMEAKDGSMGFDFGGTFTTVDLHKRIAYTMGDGRKVDTLFTEKGEETLISESFEPEDQNPVEMQQSGWQAILNNFKTYTEYVQVFHPMNFSINIKASKKKVWDTMLQAETYKKWVSAAWSGSYYEGEWKQGSTLNFYNPEKSGTKVKVLELRQEDYVMAEHISCFEKGKEDTESKTAKSWIGSREDYTFTEKSGSTQLDITMYLRPEWHKAFEQDWPRALKQLKSMCES